MISLPVLTECIQRVPNVTRASPPFAVSDLLSVFSGSVGSGSLPVTRSVREPDGTLSGWAGHVWLRLYHISRHLYHHKVAQRRENVNVTTHYLTLAIYKNTGILLLYEQAFSNAMLNHLNG